MSTKVKNYYLSTPFTKSSKAATNGERDDLVSNLWAMFTAMETVEYSSRNLAQHFGQNNKRMLNQISKYNKDMKQRIFGANLSKLQSSQLSEGVINSAATTIETLGYALTVPDCYMDEFLEAIENKSKELQVRYLKDKQKSK